jgi:hypothetical protein
MSGAVARIGEERDVRTPVHRFIDAALELASAGPAGLSR